LSNYGKSFGIHEPFTLLNRYSTNLRKWIPPDYIGSRNGKKFFGRASNQLLGMKRFPLPARHNPIRITRHDGGAWI
jgi:hypothetical protein